MGALGWIYKAWVPARLTDARERFRRAYQLKNVNQSTYEHWANMEWKEREWARSAEAAGVRLKLLPASKALLYMAGRARHRLARESSPAGLHHDKGSNGGEACPQSRLERAIEAKEADDQFTEGEICRALVLVCEMQADVVGMQKYFSRWRRSSSGDPDLASEWSRLSKKFKLGTLDEPVLKVTEVGARPIHLMKRLETGLLPLMCAARRNRRPCRQAPQRPHP